MPLDLALLDRLLSTPLGEAGHAVVEKLTDAGYEAWWVGGTPRDLLLGKLPKDIDIATSARPDDIVKLFPRCDDSAAALGNIIVSIGGQEIEVTTFREDAPYGDGRRPDSVTCSDREHDAKRRDFTINALYLNPITRELLDPFDGAHDLQELLVRFIGEPASRIQEDALRIVRAVRLRARIQGQYDPATYKALQDGAKRTAKLSGARIAAEMEAILLGPHQSKALEDLWELHVLKEVLPEVHACKGIAQPLQYHQEGDVFTHLCQCVEAATEDHGADVRWAALLHDIGKARTFALKERIRFDEHASVSRDLAKNILERFQFSRERREKICWIVEHHMMVGAFKNMPEERKAHWYYHQWFTELLQVCSLDVAGTTPSDFSLYESVVEDYNAFLDAHPRPQRPLLSGIEIMEILGIEPGAKVGEASAALAAAQVRKEVTTKKEATAFVAALEKKP